MFVIMAEPSGPLDEPHLSWRCQRGRWKCEFSQNYNLFYSFSHLSTSPHFKEQSLCFYSTLKPVFQRLFWVRQLVAEIAERWRSVWLGHDLDSFPGRHSKAWVWNRKWAKHCVNAPTGQPNRTLRLLSSLLFLARSRSRSCSLELDKCSSNHAQNTILYWILQIIIKSSETVVNFDEEYGLVTVLALPPQLSN